MSLKVISLEETIERLTSDFMANKKKATKNEALKAVKEDANKEYSNQINQALNGAAELKQKCNLVIYLDKNYLPAEFRKISE